MDQTPQQPTNTESLGIHMLGSIAPQTLQAQDFDQSPELLYHWAAKPFTYMQHTDPNIPDYFLEDKDRETLGQGFYTTDNKNEAEFRSKNRQGDPNALPIIIPLLPYQARMADFRNRTDAKKNGAVPSSMANRWLQAFTDYYRSDMRQNLPWTMTEIEDKYFLYLHEVIKLPAIDLRVMLGTVPFSQSPNVPNPPWSRLFANFITREGLDGLIYNEASLSVQHASSTVFVFFNLLKIGTYESWHAQSTQSPQRPS